MRPARVSFDGCFRGRLLAGVLLSGLAACGDTEPPDGPASAVSSSAASFTPDDREAVRALEEAYRTAWLANDSAAVMATLSPDAVLMPAGVEPLAGDSEIRAYWWPDDGSQTTIDRYEIEVEEVAGSGDLAYLRGRGLLEFTYVDAQGEASDLTSEAAHLSIARRGDDGRWRIARRAWSRVQ